MHGLIHGLGAVLALAIAAPAFAGDLTSIELDPSGKIAIAVFLLKMTHNLQRMWLFQSHRRSYCSA